MGHARRQGDGQGSARRPAGRRQALRLVAGLLVACAGVLAAGRPVALSERAELPYELARAAFAAAERVEIAERAAMRPVSEPAERGGRVLSRYTQLKQFRTGQVGRIGPRLSEEIAAGDMMMLTALSGLPAEHGVAMASLSRFDGSGNPLRDTVDTQMASLDAPQATKPAAQDAGSALGLAYAPVQGPSASTRFDALLKPAPSTAEDDRTNAFVPPLGERDHAWAATPLPAEAFGSAEQTCLATGLYFEARGESERGQAAVAQVILNRVRNPTYPDTICGVVYQNRHWRNRCQFSFACDGRPDRITNKRAYARAERIAMAVTTGQTWLPEVGSATHYHATYVRPRWARAMEKVEKIGLHVFYRTEHGGWR